MLTLTGGGCVSRLSCGRGEASPMQGVTFELTKVQGPASLLVWPLLRAAACTGTASCPVPHLPVPIHGGRGGNGCGACAISDVSA